MAKIIMAWSECSIKVGNTGENDAPATSFKDLGTIKDKTSVLEAQDGDTLEMKKTGGAVVGREVQEGALVLTTRIIEPSLKFYTLLGLGAANATTNTTIDVKTHLVDHELTVKVIPHKVGAKGLLAPKCSCSVKPGWSEEDGTFVDVTFGVLKSEVLDYWYQHPLVASAEDWKVEE